MTHYHKKIVLNDVVYLWKQIFRLHYDTRHLLSINPHFLLWFSLLHTINDDMYSAVYILKKYKK